MRLGRFLGNQIQGIALYLDLFVMRYTDDTILLAESSEDLQLAIKGMKLYCEENKLNMNTDKTDVMVFSRGKIRDKPVIYFGGNIIDVVFEYISRCYYVL